MEDSLAQVVRDLQAGVSVEENFRSLFDRLYGPLRRCFYRQGLSAETAEDFLQEVMTRVYREIREYRWEAPFEAWVLQIARNHVRKHFRSQQALKRQREEVPLSGDWQQGAAPAAWAADERDQPLFELLIGERRQLVRQAVDRLPAQMRRCMKLRLERDLDYREIGQILCISEQTVKVHMFQARKRLAEGLKAQLETIREGSGDAAVSATKSS